MELNKNSSKTCPYCNLDFAHVSAKNKHIKNIHNLKGESSGHISHIICPLCVAEKLVCGSYKKLEIHLREIHGLTLQTLTYDFTNKESFQEWYQEQNIETGFQIARTNKYKDYVEKLYNCNRSNSKGHTSKCSKRMEKAGGSIKMFGVCPFRLNIKMWKTGNITVIFCKSHVGHNDNIRSQHLPKEEKSDIVTKLSKGVSVDRIIEDARIVTTENIQQINLLTRSDVSYLVKKHNVLKRKHNNSDVAELLAEEKPSATKEGHNERIKNCILEKKLEDASNETNGNATKQVEINTVVNFLNSLEDQRYKKFMEKITLMMEEESKLIVHKRRIEKQNIFPAKKKK